MYCFSSNSRGLRQRGRFDTAESKVLPWPEQARSVEQAVDDDRRRREDVTRSRPAPVPPPRLGDSSMPKAERSRVACEALTSAVWGPRLDLLQVLEELVMKPTD
ncbi:hypothetical protein OG883_15840 [Streptomyces sp. NBC_01142]|nr:hypothetical protein [Streptomyces sp. NBC_01142]